MPGGFVLTKLCLACCATSNETSGGMRRMTLPISEPMPAELRQ